MEQEKKMMMTTTTTKLTTATTPSATATATATPTSTSTPIIGKSNMYGVSGMGHKHYYSALPPLRALFRESANMPLSNTPRVLPRIDQLTINCGPSSLNCDDTMTKRSPPPKPHHNHSHNQNHDHDHDSGQNSVHTPVQPESFDIEFRKLQEQLLRDRPEPGYVNEWNRKQGRGARYKKKIHVKTCHICHKEFSRPSTLKTHIVVHSPVKPFKCTHPGCNKSYNVKSNLRRHEKKHQL